MEKVHGGDIYSYNNDITDFSANINPLGINKGVADAIMASVENACLYPDTEYRRLREAISKIEGTDPENIVCGNGAAELIFNLTAAMRPKKVLFMSPTFAEYEKAADTCGGEKIFYLLKEENDFDVDEDILESIPEADMMFICQPNNPTGRLIPRELFLKIMCKCEENGVFLVIDECFLDFTGEEKEKSAVRFVNDHKYLFVLKAFTKMFAIPGIRMGYGICSNKNVMRKIYSSRQPWNVSCTAEAAGMACCDVYEETVKKTTEYINEEKAFIYGQFDSLGIKYFDSRANYILFRSREGLKEEMAEKGFLIRSCANYKGLDGHFYRIAIKSHKDNERMIKALEECICQRR